MGQHYQFAYAIEDGLALLPGLLSMIPSGAIHIATYVLTSLALYTMANRRGINHPWLSWVPVLNVWIIGSLSDQYRYVVKGQDRSKRKVLLTLSIISSVITAIMVLLVIAAAAEVLGDAMYGMLDEDTWEDIIGPALGLLGLALPLAGVKIAEVIFRYMALYDVYTSCDPQYNVLFLVLSILFGITEPFFLFFSRNKDLGMPPRREPTEYVPLESQPTIWEEPDSL